MHYKEKHYQNLERISHGEKEKNSKTRSLINNFMLLVSVQEICTLWDAKTKNPNFFEMVVYGCIHQTACLSDDVKNIRLEKTGLTWCYYKS